MDEVWRISTLWGGKLVSRIHIIHIEIVSLAADV